MNPFFWPDLLLWTKEGGVLAIAHVRGGGELGEEWHRAGFKTTKPNTWKDLIACTEYLISEEYTSPKKVAIYSASAGGILVGRAMTERPHGGGGGACITTANTWRCHRKTCARC